MTPTEYQELEYPPLLIDSKTIALIAAKKNFDPEKEHILIQKAATTKCRCKHPTMGAGICFYRTCRHNLQSHPLSTVISR